MKDTITKLREMWEATTKVNRIMLVAAVTSALAVGLGFMMWASSPEFVNLVQGPNPSDTKGIIDYLKTNKIDYRISADGQTIEVPAKERARVTMELMSNGQLNSGKLGYELLKNSNSLMTSNMENVNLKRAVEGEMENAIQTFKQISSAKVQLTPGDQSPFVSTKHDASAAIQVGLKSGQDLSKENVQAIVNLVSRSYSGLTTKNITLTESGGRLLWNGNEGDGSTSTGQRREEERAVAEKFQRQIEQLTKPLGPGMAHVAVDVVLNLDNTQEKKHEVSKGVPVEETTTEEKAAGKSSATTSNTPSGIAANGANPANSAGTPDTQPLRGQDPGGNGIGKYDRTISSIKTEATTTDTNTVRTPGEVKEIAVSVQVDEKVPPKSVAALRSAIENLIGVNPADPLSKKRVTVVPMAFDRTAVAAADAKAAAEAAAERTNKMIGYGVPIVLMVAMLIILSRSLKKPPPPAALATLGGPQLAMAGGAPAGRFFAAGGMGEDSDGLDLMVGDDVAPGTMVGQVIGEDGQIVAVNNGKQNSFKVIEAAFDANLESILHLSKSKPDTVAVLLKTWMNEDA